jgi:hypothetical protein
MTAPIYATEADLIALTGVQNEAPEAILARASADVRRATRSAVYDVDGESQPIDVALRDALRDATLWQAAALIDAKIAPGTNAASYAKGEISSKSLGGASVSYAIDSAAVAARSALASGSLCDTSLQILDEAGLISNRVLSANVARNFRGVL